MLPDQASLRCIRRPVLATARVMVEVGSGMRIPLAEVNRIDVKHLTRMARREIHQRHTLGH